MKYPDFDGTQLCREIDPEVWFPENYISNAVKDAKSICNRCEWQVECLEYALHYNVDGIWGATIPNERRKIRRRRNIIAEPLYFQTERNPK